MTDECKKRHHAHAPDDPYRESDPRGKLCLIRLTDKKCAIAFFHNEAMADGVWLDALDNRIRYHCLAVEFWREITWDDIDMIANERREVTLQIASVGLGEPRLSTEVLIDLDDDGIAILSDDELQSSAAECMAEAERCYREAREWNRRAGEHRERLNRISQEIMRQRIEKKETS